MFYRTIGIMSGTSLDGLDVVQCDFVKSGSGFSFQLNTAQTYAFPKPLAQSLARARALSSLDLLDLDLQLGTFIGSCVNDLLHKAQIKTESIDFIASHGHTVFHQPDKRLTWQIGKGQEIARVTGIPTICDFREKDVLYGGQGAPLVPVGDRDLFRKKYDADAFVNLGGFANITVFINKKIQAFDIGPCNLVLNHYAKVLGYPYDKGGELGRIAKSKHPHLVQTLNDLPYFHQEPPKSLGAEWLDQYYYKLLDIGELSAQDKLGISYEVISDQLAKVFREKGIRRALLTGGGVKNDFLLELMRAKFNTELIVPDTQIIDFKEALVFAYLGVLFMQQKANSLKEVTAARESVCGGVLYRP